MKPRKGINLTQIILMIAIVASIAIIVTRYFSQNDQDLRVNTAFNQIKLLKHASYDWLQKESQTDFSGSSNSHPITLQSLINMRLVTKASTISTNPWGGKISIAPGKRNPAHVEITLHNVPEKACQLLNEKLVFDMKTPPAPCTHSLNLFHGEF